MATWFRVDVGVRRHPKVRHLRRLLGLSEREAVGSVVLLWDFVTDYCTDGRLTSVDSEGISERMDLVPRTDDEVIGALIDAKLLDRDRWGLSVHGYMKRNGRHLHEAERKRTVRERGRNMSADTARTVRGQSAPTDVRDVQKNLSKELNQAQPNSDSDTRPVDDALGWAGDRSPGDQQHGLPDPSTEPRHGGGMHAIGEVIATVVGQIGPAPVPATQGGPVAESCTATGPIVITPTMTDDERAAERERQIREADRLGLVQRDSLGRIVVE